jgi:hypothetical protein
VNMRELSMMSVFGQPHRSAECAPAPVGRCAGRAPRSRLPIADLSSRGQAGWF